MARKERNDIDYFPHPVNHGKKMFYIRNTFGNDGYAVWFMLLEHLGKANYHYLDLSDEVELMYLSSEFKVSETLLKEIINSLVKFGEFDKELWEENSILYNQKFIDNISDAYNKRKNDCIDKNSLVLLLIAKGVRKPSKSNPKQPKGSIKGVDNPQRILKDTKLKDTKLKEDENSFNFFWDYYHSLINKNKTDKEPAFKYWCKLSLDEQRKAYNSVLPYSKTNELTYLKKARTYLSDKNYNDEFLPISAKTGQPVITAPVLRKIKKD